MITELKANTTYKLIDKKGYLGSGSVKNPNLYVLWFDDEDCVTLGYIDTFGRGCIMDDCIISEPEFKFFEEVVAEPETPKILSEGVNPLTRTVYRKTTLSTKELLTEMLVNGKVYWNKSGNMLYSYSNGCDEFIFKELEGEEVCTIPDIPMISTYFHEKVEEEFSWQEQLCEEFDTSYEDKEDNFVVHSGLSTAETIKLAKRIIELSSKGE